MSERTTPPFRPQVLAQRAHQRARSELLAIDPGATRWAGVAIALGVLAIALWLGLGRINEYANGPALVRLQGRTVLTAQQAAVVVKVEAFPGKRVEQGDVLVQFYAEAEAAAYEAARREFGDQLAKLLRRPDDLAAREALVSLRAQRDLAEQRMRERTLRAPHAGTVGDVRVRSGQLVEPGMSLVELSDRGAAPALLAILPGRYRPFLKPGDPILFTVDGFPRRVHELAIGRVSDQIVGPAEAARYVGRDLADALPISGPVVLVEAPLPASFESDGTTFEYVHGMHGKVDAAVRNESFALAFIPGLRQWAERARGVLPWLGEMAGERAPLRARHDPRERRRAHGD